MGEAIKAYKQAVAIDPRHADAWGALALSYRYPLYGPGVQWGDPREVHAAANRSLALDPGNADARLALILVDPLYRHWREREAQLRVFLRDHPDSVLGHVCRGWLLLEVGRIEDAVAVAEQAIAIDPALKTVWFLRTFAYYFSGRDSAGDVNIEELRSRWPQDAFIYYVGYYWLLCERRFKQALAYAVDVGRRPRTIRPEMAEINVRKADALATGRGFAEFRNRSLPAVMQMQIVEFSVIDMALFGKVEELFALYEASFFGGEFKGTRFPPPGPLDQRYCFGLFFPALAGLRGDPRYASLLQRTGLEDYWRKSGTQPDFRQH
jgi:tetratricopeptide (TPR) repeat protein